MSPVTTSKPVGQAIPAIATYCFSSILMTLVNKFVLSGFSFHMVFLMLFIQSISSVGLLLLFKALGWAKSRRMNSKDAKAWLPVAALMATMLYTGGKSLQYLSVPNFTIFKNITIIFVAYGEKLVFGNPVTPMMLLSFGLMVLSSIVGGWSDLDFNIVGYLWMGANCFASASFVIRMRQVIKQVDFQDFDTVYFNNLLTAPMFLFMSIMTENWSDFLNYYSEESNSNELSAFVRSLIVSGIASFLISFSSSWCIRVTTSTTYSMTGALNKLPIALAGLFYFSETVTTLGVLSILIGFVAGVTYTYARIVHGRANQSKANYTPLPKVAEKTASIKS